MDLMDQYPNNIIIKYIVGTQYQYWNIEKLHFMSKLLSYDTNFYTQQFSFYDLDRNKTKYYYTRFQDNLFKELQIYISEDNIEYCFMYRSEHFFKKYINEYIILSADTELVTIFDKDLNDHIVNIHSSRIEWIFNISLEEVINILKNTRDIILARSCLDKLTN